MWFKGEERKDYTPLIEASEVLDNSQRSVVGPWCDSWRGRLTGVWEVRRGDLTMDRSGGIVVD